MAHARLTHPTRPTLEFYQGQQDEYGRTAVANVISELAVERPSLVHTTARDEERSINGTVTGLRRAANDGTTDDPQQALANYVVELENHVNEFQGDPGYTFEDDQLDVSRNAVLETVEWTLSPGERYRLDYSASIIIGQGTLEERPIGDQTATVDTTMSVPLRVDGVDCPGMRMLQGRKELGVEVNPLYNRSSAEQNDVLFQEGVTQTIVFEGVHSGSLSARRSADSALSNLLATQNNVTLETQFPGYDLDGFVTAYNSTLEDQRGGHSHRYRLEFTVGQRA